MHTLSQQRTSEGRKFERLREVSQCVPVWPKLRLESGSVDAGLHVNGTRRLVNLEKFVELFHVKTDEASTYKHETKQPTSGIKETLHGWPRFAWFLLKKHTQTTQSRWTFFKWRGGSKNSEN